MTTTLTIDARERAALTLLQSHGGSIPAEMGEADAFSDDREPSDTWNRLFTRKLAKQQGVGDSGDAFVLTITPDGIKALMRAKHG